MGVEHSIEVDVTVFKLQAFPPMVTVVLLATKPFPAMVTKVPPFVLPEDGVIEDRTASLWTLTVVEALPTSSITTETS